MSRPLPRSCDTFVALPPCTKPGCVVFGKNSDRPSNEVQEVVAYPAASYPVGSTVKCTYISIPQVAHTYAVILSKPAWLWGAEMAANSEGVVVGNEAVWTNEKDGPPALLGMDFVRLLAERCSSSEQAVDIFAQLLEAHGQGGGCAEGSNWSYHNSFLVADRKEAWVIETAGKWWVAERIREGLRNISNVLSIRTKFDKCHPRLREYCGDGSLDFKLRFSARATLTEESEGKDTREVTGRSLLEQAAASKEGVTPQEMMLILGDEDSGICMPCDEDEPFTTTGSQVSHLEEGNDVHWFTGTPDPSRSVFKPFRFSCLRRDTTQFTQTREGLRIHPLWEAATRAHKNSNEELELKLRQLEQQQLISHPENQDSFWLACKAEMELYDQHTTTGEAGVYCSSVDCFAVLKDGKCVPCSQK